MTAKKVLNNIKEMREDGWTTYDINKHEMDALISLIPELAALEVVLIAARKARAELIRPLRNGETVLESAYRAKEILSDVLKGTG